MAKYLFIGGGNMAKAMITSMTNQQVYVVEKNEDSQKSIKALQVFNCVNESNLNDVDCIILAIKPQDSLIVLQELQDLLTNPDTIILSIMAGIETNFIAKFLKNPIVRAMPNTPILIKKGTTGIFSSDKYNKGIIENIFANSSKVFYLENEEQMHALTAMSGSSPAYVFYILNYLTKAGMELGLDEDLAKNLVSTTFIGASEMALQSNDNLEILQQKVTSKGGTTEKAIQTFDNYKINDALNEAVKKVSMRSKEISEMFE